LKNIELVDVVTLEGSGIQHGGEQAGGAALCATEHMKDI